MSTVTSHVTALSAKVALSRKSRVQLSTRAPARAPARSSLVCKAEVTNGNGAFRVASRFRPHRRVSRRVSGAYPEASRVRTDAIFRYPVASASFSRSVRPSSDRRAPSTPETGAATVVTDATFEAEVLKSDIPVLVDFWAPWCGPCRMIAPLIDQLAEEYDGKLKAVRAVPSRSLQGSRDTPLFEACTFRARAHAPTHGVGPRAGA